VAESAREPAAVLVEQGIELDRLGRTEEALAAFEAVVRRFGASEDPAVRRPVALALCRRASALDDLGRRDEELAACAELTARFGDAPEHELRRWAGQALTTRAWLLAAAGREEDAIAAYAEVVARFGAGGVLPEYDLVCAIHNRGLSLDAIGRYAEAIAAFDDVVARFAGTTDPDVAGMVVAALAAKSVVALRVGNTEDGARGADKALAVFDRFVAELGTPNAEMRAAVTTALASKAAALWADAHNSALVAIYDELLARAAPAPAPGVRATVFGALLSFSAVLSNLGLDEKADALPSTAAKLLGDAGEPDPPPADEPSDDELAALLGDTYRSDCWRWFATPDVDRPRDELAARAVDLFRRTAPVIALSGDSEPDSPRIAAAFLVRSVANGYALLSRPGPVGPGARARLPSRSMAEIGIRTVGLDRWADDQDRPLGLGEADDDADPSAQAQEAEGSIAGFPLAFAKAARVHDLYGIARRSPFAGELLVPERDRAANAVSRAIDWVEWLSARRPEAAPAAIAMLLMAQAAFVAARSPAPADEWFLGPELIRAALDESDVRQWCAEAGVALPGWLARDSSP
jgi:tetratricopeptide (TPR) repeat protein